MTIILHTLSILSIIFILTLSILILRPARKHRKRLFSTIFIKTTYIFYLAIILFFIYFIMFFDVNKLFLQLLLNKTIFNFHFIILIMGITIPTIGIVIRRNISKRTTYNIIFSIVNMLFAIYFVLIAFKIEWFIN
jgi:hypothetical protein